MSLGSKLPVSADRLPQTVFLRIGVAKSETTLLARVLDQHPATTCTWESHAFTPPLYSSIFNPASISWRKHGFRDQDVQRWAAVWRAEPQATLSLSRPLGLCARGEPTSSPIACDQVERADEPGRHLADNRQIRLVH
jgi:hypothetical protein